MLLAMFATGCGESKQDLERVKRMLYRQIFKLKDDVDELERRIEIAERLGTSAEQTQQKHATCQDLPVLREKLMTKWDAFQWDRISLASNDNLTWAVDTFPQEGKQLEALGDRIEATRARVHELCR